MSVPATPIARAPAAGRFPRTPPASRPAMHRTRNLPRRATDCVRRGAPRTSRSRTGSMACPSGGAWRRPWRAPRRSACRGSRRIAAQSSVPALRARSAVGRSAAGCPSGLQGAKVLESPGALIGPVGDLQAWRTVVVQRMRDIEGDRWNPRARHAVPERLDRRSSSDQCGSATRRYRRSSPDHWNGKYWPCSPGGLPVENVGQTLAARYAAGVKLAQRPALQKRNARPAISAGSPG